MMPPGTPSPDAWSFGAPIASMHTSLNAKRLAAKQNLLRQNQWEGAYLKDLVRTQLACKRTVSGEVRLNFARLGLEWRLTCPAANVLEA
jgi:hypothetical protein